MSRALNDRYENEDGDRVWLRCTHYPTRDDVFRWLADEWADGLCGDELHAITNEAVRVRLRLRDVLACSGGCASLSECRCAELAPSGVAGSDDYWEVAA